MDMQKILLHLVVITFLALLATSLILDITTAGAQEVNPKLEVINESSLLPAIQPLARPTPIPLVIPPPADPGQTRLIILGGVIAVVVVIVGVWINRRLVT
jgi:hypothetical protein